MKPNRTRLKMSLAVRHVRSIKKGIEALYSVDQILDAWYELHNPASDMQTTVTSQQARDWVKVQAHRLDTERLNLALGRLYADGWILGQDLGYYEIAKVVRINKAAPSKKQLSNSLKMNWNKWMPGNRAAAALVEPPNGLKRLLAGRGIKINDLSSTTLNRIGTALADGLRAGATRQSIAEDLSYILGDDARALAIAGTEMSAAVVQSNLDLYAESGVEQVEYLVADPCDECAENEEASPIPLGEEFPNGNPPVHPNCMCDIAPYVVDTGLWEWLKEEE